MNCIPWAILSLFSVLSTVAHAEILKDLEAAEASVYEAWEDLPLTIRNVRLTVSEADSFGVYDERENNRFNAGEPIYIYAEPVGYDWKEISPDSYNIDFFISATVFDADGNKVGTISSDLEPVTTGIKLTTFMLKYELQLSGASSGDYVAVLELVDDTSKEKATFEVPIAITD